MKKKKRTRRKMTNGSLPGAARRTRVPTSTSAAVGWATAAFLFLAVTGPLCPHPALAEEPPASPELAEAQALVDRVVDRYEGARSYRIEFTQESYWALADTSLFADGVLFLERPDRISVSYSDGGRIVVDGDSMRVFVAMTNQFFVTTIESADVMLDPAVLLREFHPDRLAPVADDADDRTAGTRTVSMRPSVSFTEPARILATIDPRSHSIVNIVAFSTAGDRTAYRMHACHFDVPAPDGAFVLPKPEGAELITDSPFGAQ